MASGSGRPESTSVSPSCSAGSLAGFSAYKYLLSRVPPELASSYAYVNPAIAVMLGVVFANESIGPREMIAMFVILASVIVLTTAKSGPAPASGTPAEPATH